MKEPVCKGCGRTGHYKMSCIYTAKKAIPTYKPLRASTKPLERKPYTFAENRPKPLKRSKIASQSSSERAKLIREADRVFSIYIRHRGSIGGYNWCYTCGVKMPWRELTNGHFINRRKLAVRWDEINCNPQCMNCNGNLSGNLEIYEQKLKLQHSDAVTFHLQQKVNAQVKVTAFDLREIIDTYTPKIASLV